ncbi:unnamed protein product [Protopolystoma xenopodis]|uniref:Uncharacterized protein n=1 Tax=Protopolystoma xenopodis TaxID=117903 RepID=A0A3S5AUC7_9PLAT|nr:unnamed protein product [Protopolystoma xenopodis]
MRDWVRRFISNLVANAPGGLSNYPPLQSESRPRLPVSVQPSSNVKATSRLPCNSSTLGAVIVSSAIPTAPIFSSYASAGSSAGCNGHRGNSGKVGAIIPQAIVRKTRHNRLPFGSRTPPAFWFNSVCPLMLITIVTPFSSFTHLLTSE